jgi:hypothetical protein
MTIAMPQKLPQSLADLLRHAESSTRRKSPPKSWNPAFCGDLDMRIASDGTWHYLGTPIGRPALVKLFASILRKEADRYVLVTPVEKVGIRVDDVPFVAVEIEARTEAAGERRLLVRTNLDDVVAAGPDHPIRFVRDAADGLRPYILVHDDLWARATRAVMLELVDMAENGHGEDADAMGVYSQGAFFRIGTLAEFVDASQ